MFSAFMDAARRARAARHNYRLLSELDDAILSDLGLHRDTLRQFCDDGCGSPPGPKRAPRARSLLLMPQIMRPARR